jgi:S1-C subfamily serine protease
MRCRCLLVAALLMLAGPARADDALPLETVQAIKAAAVYIKVESAILSGTGSGFLLRRDGTTALIVTNYHVARPKATVERPPAPERPGAPERPDFPGFPELPIPQPPFPFRPARPPLPGMPRIPGMPRMPGMPIPPALPRGPATVTATDATITVVFDSGARTERSARAKVVAEDEKKDLAILEVRDVKDLPEPIRTDDPPRLVETMPVYVFGFPFGKKLATGKGNPAITVGRGSVSSIRLNDDGELSRVQIDGAINPGNSGGPVVDAKGRLVGIAFAYFGTEEANTGIGLAIPAQELGRMVAGRVGTYNLRAVKRDKDSIELNVELRLIDPLHCVRGVALHCAPGTHKGKPGGPLSALPDGRKVVLEIKDQVAAGKVVLPAREGGPVPVSYHAEFVNGEGKTEFTEVRNDSFNLPGASVPRPDPPAPPVPPPPAVRRPDVPAPPPAPPALVPGRELTREELARVLADVKGGDSSRRRRACERLAAARPGEGRKEVVETLAPLLAEPNLFTRLAALKAHVAWAGTESAAVYYDLLKTETNFIARAILMEALAKLEGVRAAEAIAARLPEGADRGAAARALEAIGSPAEKYAVPFLSHRDWLVRIGACEILEKIGTAASVEALRKAADGLDGILAPGVTRAAEKAIAAIAARR